MHTLQWLALRKFSVLKRDNKISLCYLQIFQVRISIQSTPTLTVAFLHLGKFLFCNQLCYHFQLADLRRFMKMLHRGNSLMVPRLVLGVFTYGTRAWSLVRELRFHEPSDIEKKKKSFIYIPEYITFLFSLENYIHFNVFMSLTSYSRVEYGGSWTVTSTMPLIIRLHFTAISSTASPLLISK